MTNQERLLAKIMKRKPDECWPWTGSRDKHGYGRMSICNKPRLAHRLMYEFINGPIPNSAEVCHKCDNPPCCNPQHLVLGTHKDNMHDSIKKGRAVFPVSPVGELHYNSKLTAKDVLSIREQFAAGASNQALGKQFAVAGATVLEIIHKRRWKHIGGPSVTHERLHPIKKLTANDVARIRNEVTSKRGHQAALARRYKVSTTMISNIVRNLAWK